MPSRRSLLTGLAALAVPGMAAAQAVMPPVTREGGRAVIRLPAEWAPTDVELEEPLPPGLIYVDIAGTWLFLGLPDGRARRYKTAVGAAGRNFQGEATVGRKAEWPSWTPTPAMIRAEPEVYGPWAGGLPGGHEFNPLGARALYLYQGGRDTLYRIHGTPQPWTLGQSFSSGCIRLMNEHAIDLYDRVPVGAPVVVA